MKSCDLTWAVSLLRRRSRALGAGLGACISCLAMAAALAASPGGSVVILYREGNADSIDVARHYARARAVPDKNLIGLKTSSDVTLTRAAYESEIQEPLLRELQARGLARFDPAGPPPAAGTTSAKSRCTESSVRCLVLSFGMPYRIANAPKLLGAETNSFPEPLHRNNASVDSEISLLPIVGRYSPTGILPNPFYGTTNAAVLTPTNGVFLVGRLDGPSPAIARRLVDHALSCETNGFMGEAFFDLRNITSGSYRTGDLWITNAAAAAIRTGFATHVDNLPATLPATQPLPNVGLYFGWYTQDVDGPFLRNEVEFLPGSIAYHLHSFSAGEPRNPSKHWVGPLLAKGATVTFGCVDEPYLEFTPNPHAFLEMLVILGYSVGEAALACQPSLSWTSAFFGDPLFHPFDSDLRAVEQRQLQSGSPAQAWTILRQVNILIQNGQSLSAVRDQLAAFPLATNHPVLAEKVAQLYAADSRHKPASEWFQRALELQPTPQHRLRILLSLADSLAFSQQAPKAVATLRTVETLRPDYTNLLSFRQRQLDLAKDTLDVPDMRRLQDEVVRIKSPPPGEFKPAPRKR